MARRRLPVGPPVADARVLWPHDPAEAARWLEGRPLLCDRSDEGLPCEITTGTHDEWCAVFSVRRYGLAGTLT